MQSGTGRRAGMFPLFRVGLIWCALGNRRMRSLDQGGGCGPPGFTLLGIFMASGAGAIVGGEIVPKVRG
jgi:hypothetical protein